MDHEKISVKDIAEMAGTSVATVSRVLNQNGRFSKATEEKVMQIVRQYHYKPNQLARGLRVQQTNVIGVMVPDITNEFFSSITQSVQNELLNSGYMTLICSANEDASAAKKQVDMLLGQKVSGIIYIGQNKIPTNTGVPTVYVDREPTEPEREENTDYIFIECDNRQGGFLAGEELVKKGVHNVGYIYFNGQLSTVKSRRKGLLKALEAYGLSEENIIDIPAKKNSIEDGFKAAEQLLKGTNKPDGIFCTSDILTIGALNFLQSNKIKVPEEMKIVGFDDIEVARAVYPAITTVHQPTDEIGRMAAQHILKQIQGTADIYGRLKVPVNLIVRGTT